MTNEYSYSAYTYACDWIWYDRPSIAVLSGESPEPTEPKACKTLKSFAAAYKVSRNFKTISESPRLKNAWLAIQKIQKPNDETEAKSRVRELVCLLKRHYECEALSAASKFLWIRFKTNIIIYDSLSRGWLKRNDLCGSYSEYDAFCEAWRTEYQKRRADIRVACEGLLDVRGYLPPVGVKGGKLMAVPDAELEEAVHSDWFAERVFDHFMINEESYFQSGTDGAK